MDTAFKDSILIKKSLAGDEEAFAELVRCHQEEVARLILRITRRPEWVEDLTQQAFLKAFTGLSRFRRKSRFRTWLYRIAVNESLQALRMERQRKRLFENVWRAKDFMPDSIIVQDRISGERMVMGKELQLEIKSAMDKLTPEARAVLTLRYLEEFSTSETARILEVAEGTVRSRLHHARLELAGLLQDLLDGAVTGKAGERE